MAAKDCPEDQFYDDQMEECAPCSDYCKYGENQPRLFQLCKSYCPIVYKQLTDRQSKPVVGFSSDQTNEVSDGSAISSQSDALIGIVVAAVVCVVIVGIVAVFLWRRRSRGQKHGNMRNQGGGEYTPAPTGVQEEGREKAESERHSHCQSLLAAAFCARDSSSRTPAGLQETGQEGRHELALVGSSTESCVQDETQPPKAPVTSNVAIHDFHRTQDGPVYL